MTKWIGLILISLGLSHLALAQEISSVAIGGEVDPNTSDFVKYFAEKSNEQGTMGKVGIQSTNQSRGFLAQVPKGSFKAPVDPACHPREFERIAIQPGISAKEFARLANDYFTKCEKKLNYHATPGILGLLEFSLSEYHFRDNPKIKPITFKFEDGTTTFGFIGIKDLNSKRPWVIAKCGVFCSAGESASVNNYIMSLFDENPFNMIFLGNRSGTDYVKANKKLLIGGFLESHDYFEVSRWLMEKSGYQNTIDSIHALGISLAGNASTFSSVLEKYYPTPRRPHYLDSAISVCPVINLHETLKDMYADSIKGEIFVRYSWMELQKVKDDLTEFSKQLNGRRPAKHEFTSLMGEMITHYGSAWSNDPKNNRNGPRLNTMEDLWDLNQFTSQQQVDIPLFVWASKDDSIVNNALNTQALEKSPIGKISKQVGIVNVNHGNHCGFSTSYGSPTAASILRSWVLNHSPKFTEKRKSRKAVVDISMRDAPWGSVYTRSWFEIDKNSTSVTVNAEYFSPASGDTNCSSKDIYQNPSSCFKIRTTKIPVSEFSFAGISTPTSKTEAQVLTRRLNSLFTLQNKKGLPIEGDKRAPNQVQWYSYY